MPNYQQLLTRGDHLYETADCGEAAQIYGRAVELAPQRKEAYVKLGLLYSDCGDAAAAAGFFQKAADLDPADAFVRVNLGLGLYGAGRLSEAAEQLQAAVHLIESGVAAMRAGSGDAAVRAQCAELEETAAQVRALLQEIAAARVRQRTSGPGYEARLAEGDRLEGEEEYDLAAAVYQACIRQKPSDGRAYLKLAHLLERADDHVSAIDLLRTLLVRDDRNAFAHFQMARLLNTAAQRDEAVRHLHRAAALFEEKAERLRSAALADHPEAERAAQALVSLEEGAEKARDGAEAIALRIRFSEALAHGFSPGFAARREQIVRDGRRLRLGVLITLWRRHEIADLVLARCNAVRQRLHPLLDLELCAVGSEGEASRDLAERNGFHYMEMPNDPLGAKRNAGLASMERHDLDAVVFIDSDDFIDESLFLSHAAALHEGYALLGLQDWHMLDLESLRACYWGGYGMRGGRHGEPLGLGRCIHRDLLDRVGWKLWDDALNSGLDNSMVHRLAPLLNAEPDRYRLGVFNAQEHGICAVDVKSSENIWSFDHMAQAREGVRYVAPARLLAEYFSMEEAHRLLALSPDAQRLAALAAGTAEGGAVPQTQAA